ncbi:TetR/AcrR family transcriptional regulator [Subtercola lobariae]|uniref:TetR family transcriptional regulator n=1 Tax=Subtercola lobariae TaxID=1588641 RepID=A0A917EV83_9MICO|nr:TetR/AcrR family transcriptional regulator [Subtercola lobariae]GGF19462.1 TetR family transcriptional regulator [Subtercola lobariae]
MSEVVAAPESLTVRKKRRAQQSIVDAADELFRAHGFENVSVTDIAARAEVGRTTFFRYFGDKAEVVFAHEQRMLDTITDIASHDSVEIAYTPAEAIDQLQPIVLELCAQASADPAGYTLHYELIAKHLELRARDALKTQLIADTLSDLLVSRGTPENVAIFAAQIALACAQTARRRTSNPRTLVTETRVAFEQVHLRA